MASRQIITPNINIGATSGWCLKYVDDAINAPRRTPSARQAYLNELNAGRIKISNAPVGIWVVGFLGFTTGPYVDYGHVFLMKKRSDGSIEIHDSEVHSGRRGIYNSIEECMGWFGIYNPEWLGFSYSCDGATIAEDYSEAPSVAPTDRVTAFNTFAREQPNRAGAVFQEIEAEYPMPMKGFVTNGEAINGNTTWFVTARSGKYMSAEVFHDSSTHDLPDLTPKSQTPAPVVEDKYPSPTSDALVTKVINKKHPFEPINYSPADLIDIGNGQRLRREASESLSLMMKKIALVPQSTYRSYEYQKSVYDGYLSKDPQSVVDTYSARPGYSEHQTGLVIDFSPISEDFKNTSAYRWLSENGYKYGWVLRFPEGKDSITGYEFEPWHWRYVGVKMATEMKKSGKSTLEEFTGIEGGDYIKEVDTPKEPETPVIVQPEIPVKTQPKSKTADAMKVAMWSTISVFLGAAAVMLTDPQLASQIPAWVLPLIPLINTLIITWKNVADEKAKK